MPGESINIMDGQSERVPEMMEQCTGMRYTRKDHPKYTMASPEINLCTLEDLVLRFRANKESPTTNWELGIRQIDTRKVHTILNKIFISSLFVKFYAEDLKVLQIGMPFLDPTVFWLNFEPLSVRLPNRNRIEWTHKPKQTTVLIQIISNFIQLKFSLASVGLAFGPFQIFGWAFCLFRIKPKGKKIQWTKLSRTCVWETNLKCRHRGNIRKKSNKNNKISSKSERQIGWWRRSSLIPMNLHLRLESRDQLNWSRLLSSRRTDIQIKLD